jgi:hypothetical protein
MSHFSQIHNDDDFWYTEDELKKREDRAWWWGVVLIAGLIIGLIAWSCIEAYQNPPEVRAIPVGSPG